MSYDQQRREVAAKFARDAIQLIKRDKAPDVCARKLQAAAAVMSTHPSSQSLGDELVALREELSDTVAKAKEMVTDLEAERKRQQLELDAANAELQGMKAQLSALGNGGRP